MMEDCISKLGDLKIQYAHALLHHASAPPIILPNGYKLKWLEKRVETFLKKLSIVYGPSESGKTTIVNEIMYILKDIMPAVFVIAPTNFANGVYTRKLPPHCIKSGIDIDETAAFLRMIIDRQSEVSGLYDHVNRLSELRKVFDRLTDSRAGVLVNIAINEADRAIDDMERSGKLDIAESKTQKTEIQNRRDDMLRRIYKTSIETHSAALLANESLTPDEKKTVKFLNINNNCLVILDDYASRFKALAKKSTVIKELFYEFRNYGGTLVMTAQNDKEIDSQYRKNAMNNIFTDEQSAISNFARSANNYARTTKILSELCTSAVFSPAASGAKHFKKLVYFNNKPDPFRILQADLYGEFRMCSETLWSISKVLSKQKQTQDGQSANSIVSKYI